MQSRRFFPIVLAAIVAISVSAPAQSVSTLPLLNLDVASAISAHPAHASLPGAVTSPNSSSAWHFLTPSEFASTIGMTEASANAAPAFKAANFFESQTATPTINYINVNTNGGGQSGSNYVFTFSLSDTTPNFTIHYTLYVCGQPGYSGTSTTGDFQYSCTGFGNNGATAAIYATAPGYTESSTIYPSF
jgi:hypothetical protein